jgi:hypothetical protein
MIVSIVVPRPDLAEVEQHICMDKGYDIPLWRLYAIVPSSGTAADAANRFLNLAPFPAKPASLLGAGFVGGVLGIVWATLVTIWGWK